MVEKKKKEDVVPDKSILAFVSVSEKHDLRNEFNSFFFLLVVFLIVASEKKITGKLHQWKWPIDDNVFQSFIFFDTSIKRKIIRFIFII